MKMTGIVAASVLAFIAGAKLALGAFAPVLPPDFDRKQDREFEMAYWNASYRTGEQVEYYLARGRWATDPEEMLLGGRFADVNRRWRERNERSWRLHIEELRAEMTFVSVDDDRSIVVYRSPLIEDRRVVGHSDAVRCTVTLDAEYARAYEAWYATPGARASSIEPPNIDRWTRMDCRRGTGLRAWLSWAGLDRYTERPPERYSQLEYAERAWERDGSVEPIERAPEGRR